MGDPGNNSEGGSGWTDVSTSYTQLALLNQQHLGFLQVYDPFLVSVGRKIGEGGQGYVYEAKLHLPYSFKPLPVVVKKFKPFEGVSQGHFPSELVSMRSINLCVPYGVFFEGDSLCMIMRRYSCDLRAAIDSRMEALRDEVFGTPCSPPFSEELGSFIIHQLAMGLSVLHECGVYHGDLKAANILLKTFGKNYGTFLSKPAHIVIADFERSAAVVGTGFFRAPEVLRSLNTDIPLSKEQWLLADIYSFGMVCYEVLTGKFPFQEHRVSDYDLVLNGGRPELPDHVPKPMRDLVVRCWHADPHSRPSWIDIIKVLVQLDDARVIGNLSSDIDNLVSVESLSFESLLHESKRLIRDLTLLHEQGSKSSGSEFMLYYWASKVVATCEEYASKYEVDPILGNPMMCNVQEFIERLKLVFLLRHQVFGASLGYVTFFDLILEDHVDMFEHARETLRQRERLHAMVANVGQKVIQHLIRMEIIEEFEIGTPQTGKLLFIHALVTWVLWYEHVASTWERELLMEHLLPSHWSVDSMIEALLIFLYMIMNTYIYVLAMITCEPILLCLQYGLYKIKGSNNILYRSSGERVCRFQRAWMNYTRYKVVSITLSFSFVSLLTMYGWRGILGWILFPCIIMYTPYWQQPILLG